MRARTWSLRLNLDAFNAAYMVLQCDADKAQFLAGLALGVNAGSPREAPTPAFMDGFTLGHAMRTETEAYRQAQAERGVKGGRPRKPSG